MCLAVGLKITNLEKNDRPELDISAGPCNNFLMSLFSQIRLIYNQTVVCQLNHWPIVNYVNLKLSTTDNDANTWLSSQCYVKEVNFDKHETSNVSFQKRREYFGALVKDPDNPGKKVFEYSTTPTFLIGALPNYLPPR